jgi:hypothetical protein
VYGQIHQPPIAAVLDRSRQITIQHGAERIQFTPKFNQVIHGAKLQLTNYARLAARTGRTLPDAALDGRHGRDREW